jgi:hypothetical protein
MDKFGSMERRKEGINEIKTESEGQLGRSGLS